MEIERAAEHEMPTILALIAELLAELGEEGREFAGIDRDKLLGDLTHAVASDRFVALLARDESGAAIGVLTLSESFALYAGGEYGMIDEMYVRPGSRRHGVGRALIEEAVAIARERRWFRLDVTAPTADPDRQVASFYEELGFEPTGAKLRLLL